MSQTEDWSQVLYINNVPRRITGLGPMFYADSDDLPRQRCSCHKIGTGAAAAIRDGLRVRTLGNIYSLKEDAK